VAASPTEVKGQKVLELDTPTGYILENECAIEDRFYQVSRPWVRLDWHDLRVPKACQVRSGLLLCFKGKG
jgi:hypothetical protein